MPTEDFELWVRLARHPGVRFANLPEVLLEYRLPGLQRAEYVSHQRGMATDLVVREAGALGLVVGDADVDAFRSLVTLEPPHRDGWRHMAVCVERWSGGDEAMRCEVLGRWGLVLRRSSLRDWPAAVRAAGVFGVGGAARVAVVIAYGVVRRTAFAEWVAARWQPRRRR